VGANDGDVAGYGSFHKELLTIELAHFTLLAESNRITLVVVFGWDLAVLQQRVDSCGGVESWNARTTSSYPLSNRALRTQLNLDAPTQVLLLQRLVVAQKADDELLDLPALCEQSQASHVLDTGIVRYGGQTM
jgi:hypothetical protein